MTKPQLAASALVMALICAIMAMPAPRVREIRLIGECNGKYYGAWGESDFPAGCAWIEPIQFDVD